MTDTTTTNTLASDPGARLTDGFRLLVDALKFNGVRNIYGVAGIPVTDLARIAQASGIRYIGFRREDSAGNAAAAAGFLTKRPGICLTVSAPGFLNGLPALAAATVPGISTTAFTATLISVASGTATWSLTAHSVRRLTATMISLAAGAFLSDWMLGHANPYAPVVPAVITAVVIAIASVALKPGATAGLGGEQRLPVRQAVK
jgi:hypothetical protein